MVFNPLILSFKKQGREAWNLLPDRLVHADKDITCKDGLCGTGGKSKCLEITGISFKRGMGK